MESFLLWTFAGFLGGLVFGSFVEWSLHRFVMHKPIPGFEYPFRTHALIHHQKFKADHTYHVMHEEDKEIIPMAWWNGPAIVSACMLPAIVVAWLTGHWSITVGALIAFGAYYGAYEYMHWCMHLPKKRSIERTGIFFRLNGHHLLHHRYMHKNFNVVLPLADLCLGTLLLRSKVSFAQARGPSVPDVQPRVKRIAP